MLMTDEQILMHAIIENPADDAPRLAYSDWCIENGEPERGEFIQVQIAIAIMDENGEGVIDPKEGHTCCIDPCPICAMVDKYEELKWQEDELANANALKWIMEDLGESVWQAMANKGETCVFRRGFVTVISISWQDWLTHWKAIREVIPLEEVQLITMPQSGSAMMNGWLAIRVSITLLGLSIIQKATRRKVGEASNIEEEQREGILEILADVPEWRDIKFTLPK